MLKAIDCNSDCDAFVIGCFDDTGLDQARERTEKLVIGIGQASFHFATLVGNSFSILTTLSVSIPVIEKNVRYQGFNKNCKEVIASGVRVLDLEHFPEASMQKFHLTFIKLRQGMRRQLLFSVVQE